MRVYYKWKDELKDSEWHKNTIPEVYLSAQSKVSLLENYILGREELDSEVYIEVK